MRPGWTDALRLTRPVLPHQSLTAIDERLEAAAARPVIVPETIVCDHGKAYLSATFRAACRSLGISLAPAHPQTSTDEAICERALGRTGQSAIAPQAVVKAATVTSAARIVPREAAIRPPRIAGRVRRSRGRRTGRGWR